MEKIIKNRGALMGVAIISIMLFHYYCRYRQCSFARMLQYGELGVDIFAVLSGIGIYHSLKKNNIRKYALNRSLRILPLYYVVAIGYVLWKYSIGDIDFSHSISFFYYMLLS